MGGGDFQCERFRFAWCQNKNFTRARLYAVIIKLHSNQDNISIAKLPHCKNSVATPDMFDQTFCNKKNNWAVVKLIFSNQRKQLRGWLIGDLTTQGKERKPVSSKKNNLIYRKLDIVHKYYGLSITESL